MVGVVRWFWWFARGFFFMGWAFGPLCGGGGVGGGGFDGPFEALD